MKSAATLRANLRQTEQSLAGQRGLLSRCGEKKRQWQAELDRPVG